MSRPLWTALNMPTRGIVALCGGGGKTTLMYRLAAEAHSRNIRVVCTTTTRILCPHIPEEVRSLLLAQQTADNARSGLFRHDPDSFPHGNMNSQKKSVPEEPCFSQLCGEPLRQTIRTILACPEFWPEVWPLAIAEAMIPPTSTADHEQKLRGLPPKFIDDLSRDFPELLFLVEADGAACKPLKAPAEHEPVFPALTTLAVAVIGLEVLNQPLSPLHTHRMERVQALTMLAPGDVVTVAALRVLAEHPHGLFQYCPHTTRRVVFGNKADRFPPSPDWPWLYGSAAQSWCEAPCQGGCA